MNMGLLVALVGMTSVAVAALLVPLLLRQRRAEAREAYNLAVYRDQLAEVERDVERGILARDQAEAARAEIARRMLALTPSGPEARPSPAPVGIAAGCVAMLPFAALLLYWSLGAPGVADQPFAERKAAAGTATAAAGNTPGAPHINMAEAVDRLTAHLREQPNDLEGWQLLGRSQVSLGHYKEAADAYRRAAELSGQRPDIVGDYGEALVLVAGGIVTPEAQNAFETGLKDPETKPRSRYYLALAEMQRGNTTKALQDWVDLEADSPANAAWLPLLRRRINEAAASAGVDPQTLKTSAGEPREVAAATPPPAAAPAASPVGAPPPAAPPSPSEAAMPSPSTVAETARATAGASPAERQAMIESMVARLAGRLQEHPEDGDGWVRLGRSYMVLNHPDKAREAYAHAVKLKPDDVQLKIAYAEAIIAADGDAAPNPPAEVTALMRDVLKADPANREALWYVGLAEAAAGNNGTARELWGKLRDQLPADAPERKEVEQRIAALGK
ncbi:MAG TPA: c-type cytochrome biogenesis protein CcmI [Stellaceae bacterium]|nr:c-type cytochrome biogenesis protein CcmI [Stellaceae bacterium]